MSATYNIRWFGLLTERRGLAEETISSGAATPAQLYAELAQAHRIGVDQSGLRAAVNDAFVPWDHPLADGDHIAFLPPMSGG